uniref:ATP synthase complex subunit 8 n=1 Tax=Xiphasia setifer TaxID=879906 RepID=A0A1D8BCQ1_9TELE|nr:ATP synthase F0 subunit 8 [Xiphasia setifer]
MPQLDPSPWLMISTFVWINLLIFIPPKIATHTFPKEPSVPQAKDYITEPWTW